MNQCLECNQETNNPKFCSSKCAAIFHNRNRVDKCPKKNETKKCKCIGCGEEIEINLRASGKTAKCEICNGKCKHCHGPAKFKLKGGTLCCHKSANQCPEVRKRNSNSIKENHSKGKIPGWNKLRTDYGIITAWNKGLTAYEDKRIQSKYSPEELFSNESYVFGPRKQILLKERGHICEICRLEYWLGEKITLELDHIDGNHFNNVKENLRLICPNCHSQTDTWKGRNSKAGKKKFSDEIMLEIFLQEKNIHKTLLRMKMCPSGANYSMMHNLLVKNNIYREVILDENITLGPVAKLVETHGT